MVKVLHLIRHLDDPMASTFIAEQTRHHDVTVVYLHDAVFRPRGIGRREYLLEEDAQARGIVSSLERISYPQLVEFLFENERVIMW